MFGSFNKLMDGLGIPLEPDTFAETVGIMDDAYTIHKAGSMLAVENKTHASEPSPIVDSWTTFLHIAYQGLRPDEAAALDKKLKRNVVVTEAADCKSLLQDKTGVDFSGIIDNLNHERFRRAVTSVSLKNFTETAGLGARRKLLLGIKSCEILENPRLQTKLQQALKLRFGEEQANGQDSYALTQLVLKVGTALSFAPSRMTPEIVETIRNQQALTAPMLVELVSFLATVQMIHRIESFYFIQSTL